MEVCREKNLGFIRETGMSERQKRLSEVDARAKALADEKAKLLEGSKDANLDQ